MRRRKRMRGGSEKEEALKQLKNAPAESVHRILMELPSKLQMNKDVVLAAVSRKGNARALAYAWPALQKDKEVVLAAVAQNPRSLQFASPALRADREVVLAAVSSSPLLVDLAALWFASPPLRADREVVLAAVSQNGDALQYAAEELKMDQEMVLAAKGFNNTDLVDVMAALKVDRNNFQYVSLNLKGDVEVQGAGPEGAKDEFERAMSRVRREERLRSELANPELWTMKQLRDLARYLAAPPAAVDKIKAVGGRREDSRAAAIDLVVSHLPEGRRGGWVGMPPRWWV